MMLRALLAAALAFAAGAACADAPKVVATIKPVHALIAGVMEGVGEPGLLVPAAASEHSFILRPSDAAALQAADLVFWVGPELESFMEKPLAALAARADVIALAALPGMTLLPNREGGAWESDAHAHAPGHAHDGAPHSTHGPNDMHVWLDVDNAARIAGAAAQRLSAVDPANAARYAANARAVAERLAALDAELRSLFAPVRSAPFIVFHDAYQYLERRYGLNAVGSVTVSPERKPSARRLREIRRTIAERGAVCVFGEPQFDAGLVRTAIEGTPARAAALDHLGVDAPAGADGYFAMMRKLGRTLADCLAGRSS